MYVCMYVFLSVSLSVHSFLHHILMYVADIFKHVRGSVATLKQILSSPGWGIVRGTNVVIRHKLRNGDADGEGKV